VRTSLASDLRAANRRGHAVDRDMHGYLGLLGQDCRDY
jgi:hypothetical protein